ncbi:RDD family protein [Frateuria hangzhouensis]|uniref:RDD family protein n=1 Tax=Frateuria hangzhouensis TaxID=2995589 RepID=UPI002260F5D8|nr:RDD family protein [Frateuria sp. STR12]MCX7512976.1 RDD family protein [Frateuria sp. STR12]
MTPPAHAASLPCPLWRRLTALVYDLLAVVAIVMVVGLLCQLATGGRLIATGAHTAIAWWYQPLQGLVVAAYFVASWMRGGQTLGMRPWRIRVVAGDGGMLVFGQALRRVIAAALPLLLLGLAPWLGLRGAIWAVLVGWALWFAPALFDRRRRAVHDLLAGTEVRRI